MGCPFVPQVRHGRGAAVIADIPLLESVAKDISDRYAGISFSIKMRLGIDDPEQWRAAMPVINDMPLHHLCVHPRTAKMQYGGTADTEAFALITEATTHRVVYNGDIRTPEQAKTLSTRFPSLYGIMVGRGLLGRPTLAVEISQGRKYDEAQQRRAFIMLLDAVYVEAGTRYCGASQILTHVKPYWEYATAFLSERRALKAISKAHTLAAYESAVASLRQ